MVPAGGATTDDRQYSSTTLRCCNCRTRSSWLQVSWHDTAGCTRVSRGTIPGHGTTDRRLGAQAAVQQRPAPVAGGRVHNQSGRLVDHDQHLVLVHDRQIHRLGRNAGASDGSCKSTSTRAPGHEVARARSLTSFFLFSDTRRPHATRSECRRRETTGRLAAIARYRRPRRAGRHPQKRTGPDSAGPRRVASPSKIVSTAAPPPPPPPPHSGPHFFLFSPPPVDIMPRSHGTLICQRRAQPPGRVRSGARASAAACGVVRWQPAGCPEGSYREGGMPSTLYKEAHTEADGQQLVSCAGVFEEDRKPLIRSVAMPSRPDRNRVTRIYKEGEQPTPWMPTERLGRRTRAIDVDYVYYLPAACEVNFIAPPAFIGRLVGYRSASATRNRCAIPFEAFKSWWSVSRQPLCTGREDSAATNCQNATGGHECGSPINIPARRLPGHIATAQGALSEVSRVRRPAGSAEADRASRTRRLA